MVASCVFLCLVDNRLDSRENERFIREALARPTYDRQTHGLTGSDVGRILGHRELGSNVLRGDRRISRAHAQALGKRFGLPPEVFLR